MTDDTIATVDDTIATVTIRDAQTDLAVGRALHCSYDGWLDGPSLAAGRAESIEAYDTIESALSRGDDRGVVVADDRTYTWSALRAPGGA